MKNLHFIGLVAALLFSSAAWAEESVSIHLPALVGPPLRHAANRLSDYTGLPVSAEGARQVRIEPNGRTNSGIGQQGFRIQNRGRDVVISANTETGLANGTYTLLRILMIEHGRDPFARSWDIEEQPHFSFRSMMVAPYRFGGSYGYAVLSPDRWTFDEWRDYLDRMRLTNMTTLSLAAARIYDPAYPRSEREHWRYDMWKKVMDYCHQIGLRFNWFNAPNLVSQQAFWDNPDKRADSSVLFWYGNSLNWERGKDVILANAKYTFQHFQGLDGLELIFSDGGAFSIDDDTSDPAAYIADAVHSYRKLLRDAGNDASFIYWNWILDIWTKVHMPDELLNKYPKYRTLQEDVIPLLPRDIGWLDASMLTLIQTHWSEIQRRGTPALREGLLLGKEAGFKPVIDFFWYMNPELSFNMFPHPMIGRGVQEAHYARDEIGADGVMGYRLAPTMKFVDDYIFFRLASDPSLTRDQLIHEAAAMLTSSDENTEKVSQGITALERFWTEGLNPQDLEEADRTIREVLPTEPESKDLEYFSNGLTFLTYVIRLAQPGLTEDEKQALKQELYATVRTMYVFQGLVADVVWLPEAWRAFGKHVDWMVEEYNWPAYAPNPYPEIIDRSIYPKATARPVQLQWPEAGDGSGGSADHEAPQMRIDDDQS